MGFLAFLFSSPPATFLLFSIWYQAKSQEGTTYQLVLVETTEGNVLLITVQVWR
jgi:hypothetical protein